MATAKELLAQKLKQNTQKHQLAQKDNIKELKEFRRNINRVENLMSRKSKNWLNRSMKLVCCNPSLFVNLKI